MWAPLWRNHVDEAMGNVAHSTPSVSLSWSTVARKRGPDAYVMVLAGGDAGPRLGEIIALEWRDIDMSGTASDRGLHALSPAVTEDANRLLDGTGLNRSEVLQIF